MNAATPDTPTPGAKWFAGFAAADRGPDAAAAVLGDRFGRLSTAIEKLRDRGTDKRIRKLRVTTRRADVAVRFAAPLIPGKAARRLRDRLRALRRAGGAVRRCDLYIERLARLTERADAADVRPAATAIIGQLAAERAKAALALADLLGREEPAAPHLDTSAAATAQSLACRSLRQAADAFRARSASAPLEIEPLHDLRLRAKKLRYAAELAVPVIGEDNAAALILALVPLQDELGALNDVAELADDLAGAVQRFSALQHDAAGLRSGAERLFLAASSERDRRLVGFSSRRTDLQRAVADPLESCLASAAEVAAQPAPRAEEVDEQPPSSSSLRLTGESGWTAQ